MFQFQALTSHNKKQTMRRHVLILLMALSIPTPAYAVGVGVDIGTFVSMMGTAISTINTTTGGIIERLQQQIAQAGQNMGLLDKSNQQQTEYNQTMADQRLRDQIGNEIVRSRPQITDNACNIAASMDNIAIVQQAKIDVMGTIDSIITNDLFRRPDDPIRWSQRKNALCRIGALTSEETAGACTHSPLTVGGHKSIAFSIKKDCIPFDAQRLRADLRNASTTGYTPDPQMSEIVVAMFAISQQFERNGGLPTPQQLGSLPNLEDEADKNYDIARALAPMTPVYAALADNACPSVAMAPRCNSGPAYELASTLLAKYYGTTTRTPEGRGFPPSGFCFSPRQLRLASKQLSKEAMEPEAFGAMSDRQLAQNTLAALEKIRIQDLDAHTDAILASINTQRDQNFKIGVKRLPVKTMYDNQELLGAIKELTRAIHTLQKKELGGGVRDVQFKNPKSDKESVPENSQSDGQVMLQPEDALRDLGIKVSNTNQNKDKQ